MTDLDWAGLRSAALVGTARRPVPAAAAPFAQPRAGAAPEIRLLDQAALAGAALRSGRPAVRQTPQPAAPADEAREPTPLQTQLLALIVHQPPAGARLRTALLRGWCEHADLVGIRAPAALLAELMRLATDDPALRPALRRVMDRRGEWLAAQNPQWAWALAATPAAAGGPPSDWAHLPSVERPARLAALRAGDPAAARELLASTWGTESAKDRAALLGALATGLSPADEELLERVLDDPSRQVAAQAARLLSGLPGSARAARMRARLAPLVTQHGLLRKELVIELPGEPDAAAVRDGLGRAPARQSQRGWWLRELVVGTPLSFWTDVTRADPHTVVVRIQKNPDALHALVEAAILQRDPVWAAALTEQASGPTLSRLIEVLAPSVIEASAAALMLRSDIDRLRRFLAAIPVFSPDLSRRLVAGMGDPKLSPRWVLREQDLLTRLHPACQPELTALSRRPDLDRSDHRTVTDLIQLFSVQQSIREAFT